jgi:hypothetical protein
MTPSEQDPPAVAAAEPPRAGGQVVTVAETLLEAAALTAARRRVVSWNPLRPLYAAADRMWTASAGEDQQGWRIDPSTRAAEVRLAVLVAEATIGRCSRRRDQPAKPERDLLDRQAQELDRSSRRSHSQLIGQLADLRGWIAAVATKGLQERQFAFLGPAGHGLGRHVQDVGHLRGP